VLFTSRADRRARPEVRTTRLANERGLLNRGLAQSFTKSKGGKSSVWYFGARAFTFATNVASAWLVEPTRLENITVTCRRSDAPLGFLAIWKDKAQLSWSKGRRPSPSHTYHWDPDGSPGSHQPGCCWFSASRQVRLKLRRNAASAQPTSKQPSRRVRPSFRQTRITIGSRWRTSVEQPGI